MRIATHGLGLPSPMPTIGHRCHRLDQSVKFDLRLPQTPGLRFTHVATLENMENGKAYSYAIGGRLFSFDYHRNHTSGRPDVHIIFGVRQRT